MIPEYFTRLLEPAWVERVRAQAAQAEEQGQLTPDQLAFIRQREWFRLLIPASIGGKEYSLPLLLQTLEAASWMDGSFGWVMALCGGAGFFAGFVSEPVARSLFADPGVCAAGTGFPGGTAVEVPGGYRVSGHWRYASGAPHATLYTANCHVVKTGETRPATGENDPAPIRAMIFLPDQVTLQNGWQSIGLRATASQDMIIQDAFVPHERSFVLEQPFPHADGPLFHYPFLQQAEAVLSVTLLGMARHFLDLFEQRKGARFEGAGAEQVRLAVDGCFAELAEARAAFYATVNASWAPGKAASADQLTQVGIAAVRAASVALGVSDRLYPLGGMEMMQVHTDINRVWRDIHTASQHILLSPVKRSLR